jgi:hypothetical protein
MYHLQFTQWCQQNHSYMVHIEQIDSVQGPN